MVRGLALIAPCWMMTTKATLSRDEVVRILRSEREVLKERFGVTAMYLFGSFARDEATEASDVDVLVEFEGKPSLMTYSGTQIHLEAVFGRSVDVAQLDDFRKELRPYVERDLMEV